MAVCREFAPDVTSQSLRVTRSSAAAGKAIALLPFSLPPSPFPRGRSIAEVMAFAAELSRKIVTLKIAIQSHVRARFPLPCDEFHCLTTMKERERARERERERERERAPGGNKGNPRGCFRARGREESATCPHVVRRASSHRPDMQVPSRASWDTAGAGARGRERIVSRRETLREIERERELGRVFSLS